MVESLGKPAETGTDSFMTSIRHIAAGLAALATCVAATTPEGAGIAAIPCTNPASGAQWQVRIDYGRATVDANPADISAGAIGWRDAKDGWSYTLDRSSGELTAVVASSTGGYFLHFRCQLPP